MRSEVQILSPRPVLRSSTRNSPLIAADQPLSGRLFIDERVPLMVVGRLVPHFLLRPTYGKGGQPRPSVPSGVCQVIRARSSADISVLWSSVRRAFKAA